MTIPEYKFFIGIRPLPDGQKWCEGLRDQKRINNPHFRDYNPG
jgi:hypothetical protein